MAENAIKHGISKYSQKGSIIVKAYYDKNNLVLEVVNTGKYIKSKEGGIGIMNTKRRLEIIYGKDANFTLENIEDGLVKAKIEIEKKNLKSE